MQFDSLAAAFAMEGHGPYVWTVVLISALIVCALLLLPSLSSRRILREQRAQMASGVREPAETAVPRAVIEEVNNAPGA